MKELDLKYVAGFVDGEGYVGIAKVKNPQMVGGFEYRPVFRISNTNEKILRILRDQFGGSVQKYPMDHQPNAKDMYVWSVSQGRVFNFLKRIVKHLIVKKEQANLLLDYSDSWKERKTRRLPKGELARREKLYKELRILNKKGKL